MYLVKAAKREVGPKMRILCFFVDVSANSGFSWHFILRFFKDNSAVLGMVRWVDLI